MCGVERAGRVVVERAVCLNSVVHYAEMGVSVPTVPTTGEGLLVSETLNHDSLCVGDVLEVQTSGQPVVLVVTHPRRPCHRFATKYCSRDVFFRAMHRGLGGIFCSVHRGGTLDMPRAELKVVARPYPQWTLRRVNALVYGATGWDKMAKWRGTPEEARQLLAMPEFGEWQWKEEVRKVEAAR